MRGLCIFLMLVSTWATAAPVGPSLELLTPEVDLGLIAPNAQRQFQVRLANRGSEPLIIHSISADCGCVSSIKQGKEVSLDPGQELQLPFSLATSATMRGLMTKKIVLKTNDPRHRYARVGVSFTVRPEYRLTVMPSRIKLGSVPVGTEVTREVTLVSPYPKALKIDAVTGSAEWISAKTSRGNGRGDVIALTVTVRAPEEGRPSSQTLTIVTDVGKVVIPVDIHVVGRIEVDPTPLVLPPSRGSEPIAVRMRVRAASDEAFQVSSISARDGQLSAVRTDTDGSGGQVVEFRYTPVNKAGVGRDRLRIVSDTLGDAIVDVSYFVTK